MEGRRIFLAMGMDMIEKEEKKRKGDQKKMVFFFFIIIVGFAAGIQRCILPLEGGNNAKYIHPLDPKIVCAENTGEFIPATGKQELVVQQQQDLNGDAVDDSLCLVPSSVDPLRYPIGTPCGPISSNQEEDLCGLYRCDGTGLCRDTSALFNVYFKKTPHISLVLVLIGVAFLLVVAISLTILIVYRFFH